METQKTYAAITADIVRSTEIYEATGEPIRPILQRVISDVNQHFGEFLAVPFAITLGDEFQGLAKEVSVCPKIVHYLRLQLHPLRCRIGIGIGKIASPLMSSTLEMEGPAFSRSRSILERIKSTNRLTGYQSGCDSLDLTANTISMLIDLIQDEWTSKQWEAVRAYTTYGRLSDAGAELGISPQGVKRRLQSTHWAEINESVEALCSLLQQRCEC